MIKNTSPTRLMTRLDSQSDFLFIRMAMADMAIGYGVSTEAVEKAFDAAMAATSVAIPVYDKDGVTVIGEYVVY